MNQYRVGVRERLARWWAHRKLFSGRCRVCGAVLTDEAPLRPYCSVDCRNAGIW